MTPALWALEWHEPLFAVLLGIRDGRRDAKAGVAPYVYRIIFDSPRRRESLKEGLTWCEHQLSSAGEFRYRLRGLELEEVRGAHT